MERKAPASQIKQGSIVRALVVPERGKTKYRPAVVYTSNEDIEHATHFDIVAISSSCYPDDPDHIPLPYDRNRKCDTRLNMPSSIALKMCDTVPITEVEPTWGFVPARIVAEMLKGLRRVGKIK